MADPTAPGIGRLIGKRIWMLSPVAEADREFFLSQLKLQVAQAPEQRHLQSIAVLQSRDPADAKSLGADARLVLPGASILHLSEPSVSRARNLALERCLEQAHASDFIIFRDCRSVLDRQFLQTLLAQTESVEVARTARMIWSETQPAPQAANATMRLNYDLIGHPTVGRFAFRRQCLERARFREDIGPGSKTRIKSGEDVLFLVDVFLGRGDWVVAELPGTLILAPRQDVDAKRLAYAAGQVYAARALIANFRLPVQVRRRARHRLWIFALGTLRFLRPKTWSQFRVRLSALMSRAEP